MQSEWEKKGHETSSRGEASIWTSLRGTYAVCLGEKRYEKKDPSMPDEPSEEFITKLEAI